jgi:S1-C subfamily serine protease
MRWWPFQLLVLVSLIGGCSWLGSPDPARCSETADHDLRRDRLLGASRINPVYQEGRLYGQRVADLDAKSDLARAGLHEGDTITEVDGLRVNGAAASGYLWCRLGSGDPVKLQVERSDGTHEIVLPTRAA